jgi:ATP-dependent HslUV protease subunit HslV
MTVIVYRDGILASDSLVTVSTTKVGYSSKIGKFESGHLWGYSGPLGFQERVLEYLRGETTRLDLPERDSGCFDSLIISPDGEVKVLDTPHGVAYAISAPYIAIGSGSQYAYGALFNGARAPDAVKAAIEFDAFSGGEVVTLAVPKLALRLFSGF